MREPGESQEFPEDWTVVTCDIDPSCNPDILLDLEHLPYPFDDGEFDEIHAYEVLEHLGQQGDYKFFFRQFEELHRILKPLTGKIFASVPRYDSMWAWGDPGHKRVITVGTLDFLQQDKYKANVGKNAMADYRGIYKADFEVLLAQHTEHNLWFVLQRKESV